MARYADGRPMEEHLFLISEMAVSSARPRTQQISKAFCRFCAAAHDGAVYPKIFLLNHFAG